MRNPYTQLNKIGQNKVTNKNEQFRGTFNKNKENNVPHIVHYTVRYIDTSYAEENYNSDYIGGYNKERKFDNLNDAQEFIKSKSSNRKYRRFRIVTVNKSDKSRKSENSNHNQYPFGTIDSSGKYNYYPTGKGF